MTKGRDAAKEREGEDWGTLPRTPCRHPVCTVPLSPLPTAGEGSCTQGRADPAADRALSGLTAACRAELPQEMAALGHPWSILCSPAAARCQDPLPTAWRRTELGGATPACSTPKGPSGPTRSRLGQNWSPEPMTQPSYAPPTLLPSSTDAGTSWISPAQEAFTPHVHEP